jgi:periplasmic protein CpxP/Spy
LLKNDIHDCVYFVLYNEREKVADFRFGELIMKKITVSILAVSILTIGLVSLVIAQKHGGGHGFGGHRDGFGFMFSKLAEELGLSEEQKTQAKTVLEASKSRVEPIKEALKEGHKAAKQLGKDGVFDETKVTQLANNQAELTKQMIIEKERTKAAIFAILTPEQRTKAVAIYDRFEGKSGKHRGFGNGERRGQKGETDLNEE